MFKWLESIDGLLSEYGSSKVLKERLGLLRDHIEKLEAENIELKTQINELMETVSKLTIPENFVKHRGALFLVRPDKTVEDDAYCVRCKKPMVSVHDLTPFKCSECGNKVNFTGNDLKRIIAEIKQN